MVSQKVRNRPFLSFPRRRESRDFKKFWTPAFAGVTALKTFYEPINNAILPKECYNPLNHETRRLTGHDKAR